MPGKCLAFAFACVTLHAQSIQPFTAEQTTEDYRQGLHGLRIVARRSDGARAIVQAMVLGKPEYPLNGPAYSRELILPRGEAFRLVDALRLKSTWPPIPIAEAASVLGLAGSASDCGISATSVKIIGHDIVEGFEALITLEASGDGRKVMQWLVPSLGCTVLKSNVQQAPPNGAAVLLTETKLARITIGEPDLKLFYVGSDYAEMKPSRVIELQQTALHLDPQDRGGSGLDRRYKDSGGGQ